MDLTSRLEGYLNHQIAYPNPIPILPVPKTLHDKKDTTLLQMAMKAFVKERLFGRLQNYQKDANQNKKLMASRSSSITENSRSLFLIKQQANSYKEIINSQKIASIIQEMSSEYVTGDKQAKHVKTTQFSDVSKTNELKKKRFSMISSSFDFKEKVSPERKILINSHAKLKSKLLRPLHQSFNLKNHVKNNELENEEEYNGTSFISAIDYYEKETPSFIERTSNQKLRLPQIVDKRKKITSKIDLVKNQKTNIRKENLTQLSINEEFWLLISKGKSQKPRKIREQQSIDINESLVTIAKSLEWTNQNKNSSIFKNNEAIFLSKEALKAFLNNSKISIPFFMHSLINFFEIMNKIIDKYKKVDFQSCLSIVSNHPDRAWCVAIFRFFDVNTDGKIDSSDLFKVHNFLEQIVQKIQAFKSETSFVSSSNQNLQTNTNSNKRQTTQISQSESLIRKKNKNTPNKQKSKQKTDQSQIISEQSYQMITNFMKKNLQNVKAFQKLVQNLNLRFLQNSQSLKNHRDFYNPQNQFQRINQNQQKSTQQIRYLQEALLKNKDLKISDLSLILDEVFYQNTNTKKKVIDIDYKNHNIKLSSSYVQTFTATNHNEETRMNREHLQSLKDSLKSQNKSNSQYHLSETKVLPSIKYSEFYEEKLFVPFKNIFFQCLHTDILEVK